jgi:hypothetical protein
VVSVSAPWDVGKSRASTDRGDVFSPIASLMRRKRQKRLQESDGRPDLSKKTSISAQEKKKVVEPHIQQDLVDVE